MFSRNRFNGQHGAGVAPKGTTKTKVHSPKKRAPNPKVALVIRGKIHRLLQGSDHHVPDSHLYYAGIEETQGEKLECRKDHRNVYPKVSPRAEAYSVPNGKGHGVPAGPPCVGEVELNREGCIRIPCTLQHKSNRSPGNIKRISFEGEIRTPPEQMKPPLQYGAIGPDMNGTKYAGAASREFPSPCIRPKRPYSAGDYVDYNFNRTLPNMLPSGDDDKEEESSAVIEHILKELRGINKIQEEISDLRDYLTSVRGSVEEVSSCVDAVLLEIECIRSSNKAGSGLHAGTWSGVECKDAQSPRKRPSSAYGSLGTSLPKSHSNFFPQVTHERHSVHGEILLPRVDESTVSPITESEDHQELEDQEDTSEHSSDIPVGAIARKLSFGYLETQDCQDCPSTSSLSSGHSSKSDLDQEGLSCSRGSKQHRADDGGKHWSNTGPPYSATGETVWHQEMAYLSGKCPEESGDETTICCEGASSWDYYKDSRGCGIAEQCSTESSEHLSVRSGKHYNSPASTSSREDWQSRRRKPQSQTGICAQRDTTFETPSVRYDCDADLSYSQSAGYHSVEGHDRETESFNYRQSSDLSYTPTDSQIHSYQDAYSSHEDSLAVTWTDTTLCAAVAAVDKPFSQETDANNQSLADRVPHPGSEGDIQAGGFNVKRISRAVFDFSSVLRGALRKLDVPGAQNPEEEADFEISVPYDLPLSYESELQQTSGNVLKESVVDCSHTVEEIKKDNTLEQLDVTSLEPVLEEANRSLTVVSTDTSQHLTCSDKLVPCPERVSVSLDPASAGTTILPLPKDHKDQPVEDHKEVPPDGTVATGPPQSPATKDLSVSHMADEPTASAEQGAADVPQQPSTESVAPKGSEGVDVAESSVEISQMDERKLKCLRTFQQILREKRENRRCLASVTMSTLSQDDFSQGSHRWILVRLVSCSIMCISLVSEMGAESRGAEVATATPTGKGL